MRTGTSFETLDLLELASSQPWPATDQLACDNGNGADRED